MIRRLLKHGFAVAVLWLLRRYEQVSLDLLKIRAAVYYVRGVQTARSAAIVGLLVVGVVVLLASGFVLVPIGLAVLIYGLSGSWVAACVVLLVLGALYVIVPLLVLRRFMSERAWMSFFKVDDLVARFTRKSTSD
jgi:hypothetical protein